MRKDTQELLELMDMAADLVEENQCEACLRLLVKIEKLLTLWVERHLSP